MRDQEKVAQPPQLAQTGAKREPGRAKHQGKCGPEISWPHYPVRSIKGGFAAPSWCRGHPSSAEEGSSHNDTFILHFVLKAVSRLTNSGRSQSNALLGRDDIEEYAFVV